MYTDAVVEHFSNPRNVGTIENPNVVVKVGDPGCGDAILIFLKIDDNIITDIKYKVYGCAAAIATTSMASTMVKGKTLTEALAVTDEKVAAALGGLPEGKLHCSNLSATAIRAAVTRYMHPPEEKAQAAS
ncbi:MAG: iron-sulfur cluster assembly scaffold protein [Desulfuromonadaceae bacterium]|jgi:nitrogen fixation NifU-like protein|nr:iron-sulfur cluster assembly scaffold protein [Desulfuromonas sp.]MDY0185477.1 iron-sulfur cluster assembly scaffold protein [Desulfuromonadaceae bacterium]